MTHVALASLASLTPRQQVSAGRLPRRIAQLIVGLTLYGVSMAMMVRGQLGLDPWDVLHYGLARRSALTFGQVTMVVGALVLLLWIPLRQWPGVGTVANVVVIGLATDAGLALIPEPSALGARWGLLLGGIVLNGLAGGLYIGGQLGPGPRDGLMTGLAGRRSWSIRLVRTGIELAVLSVGWLLGGVVGLGTVAYAVLIGPLVQFFLPRVTIRLDGPAASAGGGEREGEDGFGPGLAQRLRGHGHGPAGVDEVVDEQDGARCRRDGVGQLWRDGEAPPHTGQPEGAVAARPADRTTLDQVKGAEHRQPADVAEAAGHRGDELGTRAGGNRDDAGGTGRPAPGSQDADTRLEQLGRSGSILPQQLTQPPTPPEVGEPGQRPTRRRRLAGGDPPREGHPEA